MSLELIILFAFIAVVSVLMALMGTFIGIRIARRAAIKRNARREEAPAPAPQPARSEAAPAHHAESPALKSYQAILEAKGVPAHEQDSQTRDFAKLFDGMTRKMDEMESGEPEFADMIENARAALAEGRFDRTVGLLNEVGDKGQELLRRVRRQMAAAATAKTVAGDLELAQMNYDKATTLYGQALALADPEDRDLTAELYNKHGTAAYQAGHMVESTRSFQRAVDLLEETLGANHPDVATGLNNLALLHYTQGDYDRAEEMYKRALAVDEKALGDDHPGVATDLNNLALLYKKQGRVDEAEPLLKRALAIKEKHFDPGHPSLVTGLKNYASVLRALNRDDEAKTYDDRAKALPPKRQALEAETA